MSGSRDEGNGVLIEDWFPITELGIESQRERGISVAIPPLSRLHVWWARRPLVASAGVVLAGLLPSWSDEVGKWWEGYFSTLSIQQRTTLLGVRPKFYPPLIFTSPTEEWYHQWLVHLVGIWGDPVVARAKFDAAVAAGARIPNPYNYKQAYKNCVGETHIKALHTVLRWAWGEGELPRVLDSTAGGGSIPFVASRYGLPTYANDLNGVAAALLKAGVELPARHGTDLSPDLRKWGEVLTSRVRDRLAPYFPSASDETVLTYLFTNAVDCPRTGRVVPLMPNKWLRKKGDLAAVRVITDIDGAPLTVPQFDVVVGASVDKLDADAGFVARGAATSPYDNLVVDGEYVKAEATAGRMRALLYAVVVRDATGKRQFRSPEEFDLQAIREAEQEFERVKVDWQARGILPTEGFPDGNDLRPLHYGMTHWLDMFTPRQALVHGTFGEEFGRLVSEVRDALGRDSADAVLFELALLQGKALNWNSRLSSWNLNQQSLRSVFDRHDFAFKWTFAEYEGSAGLYPWTLHVLDNYDAIAELFDNTGADATTGRRLDRPVTVTQGSGADMPFVAAKSIAHLCMDPPYYDNVMYGELADFFYVWEKRTLGLLMPEFFPSELSDKENEATANAARFADMGRRKKDLATLDYQAKMTAIFAEAHRVLRDDGVMSVMFTHKRADAWDTLGASVLNAGFTIETSWPVNTESESSLHQANMNSAASTIMLVCRKRSRESATKVFLEDITSEIRAVAASSVERFRDHGIDGVDLLLSTYGPVLSVVSKHYPVYSIAAGADGSAQVVRPEAALNIAREEVVRLQRARIVGHDTTIDSHTDFLLIAWATFSAAEFPYDDARRLALAVGGLDVSALEAARVLTSATGVVKLLPPNERVRRSGDDSDTGVRVDATRFVYMNDAIDTVLHIGAIDGFGQAKAFMDRLKLTGDPRFLAAMQGMVNAIPRTKVKGEWLYVQAKLLDILITSYFHEIAVPPEAQDDAEPAVQDALFDES